jgi:hypothetical protein
MLKALPLSISAILLFTPSSIVAKEWMGIKPLHSTRATVEKVLGLPTRGDAYVSIYDREKEYVSIEYSSGPCRKDRIGGWNVPHDTVVQISVSPKTKILFSDLNLDPKKYKRLDDPELSNVVHYVDEEEGIYYSVQNGYVVIIFYVLEAKDKGLLCRIPS